MLKKVNDKSRIFKNTVLVNSAIIMEKAIFFLINIAIARYLNIHDFGEYATALGYATLFSSFVDVGINQTLIRVINLEPENGKTSFTNALLLNIILSVLMYLLMLSSLHFSGFNKAVIKLTLIFGFVRILSETFKTIYAVFDAAEEFRIYVYSTILYGSSLLISTLLIIIAGGNKFNFAYYRLILTALIMAILLKYSLSRIELQVKLKKIAAFALQTTPFAVYAIFMNLMQRFNIIIIALICGTTAAGIFNNSYLFFITLLFIPGSFSRVLVPYLYKINTRESWEKYQFAFDTFSKAFSVISFYLLVIFYLFADKIIIILYGTKFVDAAPSLKILSLGIPAMFNIASVIITSIDRQYINSIIVFVISVINIPLDIILIKLFNIEGAAASVVITFSLIFILSNMFLYRLKYINLGNIIKIYSLTTLNAGLCFLLFDIFLTDLHYITASIMVTIFYFLFVLIFLIGKDDIRIIKETLSINSIPLPDMLSENFLPASEVYKLAKQKK